MMKRSKHEDDGDRLIGRAHPTKDPDDRLHDREDSERSRDGARDDGGPRYGGERGERSGHARNDDADPSELGRGEAERDDGEAEHDDGESPSAADPDIEAARELESGGEHAGKQRGEKPRKDPSREHPTAKKARAKRTAKKHR